MANAEQTKRRVEQTTLVMTTTNLCRPLSRNDAENADKTERTGSATSIMQQEEKPAPQCNTKAMLDSKQHPCDR